MSVQPNSLVSWGNGVGHQTSRRTTHPSTATAGTTAPSEWPATPPIAFDDLKGSHTQAGRLTEWLKLALDEPELLETLGATANLGVLVSGPAGVGKATLVRAVCAERRLVELDGPEVGALRAEDRLQTVASAVATVRDGGGVLLITDIDALLPVDRRAGRHADPDRVAHRGRHPGVAFIATSAVPDALDARLRAPDLCDRELGLSLPDARHPQGAAGGAAARRSRRRTRLSTRSPGAHRVSSSPTWPRWCGRRRCGRRRGPAPTANRRH